jgi:hypothetical protein
MDAIESCIQSYDPSLQTTLFRALHRTALIADFTVSLYQVVPGVFTIRHCSGLAADMTYS